jgi:hypothetical protein
VCGILGCAGFWGLRDLGVRDLGLRDLGVRDLGLRDLGVRIWARGLGGGGLVNPGVETGDRWHQTVR